MPRDYRPSRALFDPDPDHAFNRVHRALFDRKIVGSFSACGKRGDCLEKPPTAILGAAVDTGEVELGGDEPTFFIGGDDVRYLADPKRAEEVDRAVSAALEVAPGARPASRVLLQNDLWERYDAISRSLAGPGAGADELTRIRKRIVDLMRALALPSDQLRSFPANLPEAERAYPEFLSGIDRREGWVEIRTLANEQREEPLVEGTRHARQSGYRFSFRVLARVPDPAGGSSWLLQKLKQEESEIELPRDTRLVLIGSPLALGKNAEIVAVPWVLLIETRLAGDEAPESLRKAAVDVLEGRRELLTRDQRPGGGLQQLAPDTWVPMGATCAPILGMQVPLRASCSMCHGGKARLTGPMTHGRKRFEVEDDPTRAAATVVTRKSEDPSYAELARAFRAK